MDCLSISYINTINAKFKKYTNKYIERRLIDRAIKFLKALSYIHYKFFLDIKNDFIENQIQNLAKQIVKSNFNNNGEDKSIVIIDEINADYIGLMVQYVDALIKGGYRILYLYEQIEHPHAAKTHLMLALEGCEKAQVKHIPSNVKGFSKSQWIYNEICAFGSKKVLMHFGEWAIEHSVACAALPKDCVKYRINCADHCFWAGVSCADVTFEFRHYGANLTHYERGLERQQIVYMPFYPVMQETSFEGFPQECLGRFIFLSGGAIYKIVDDNNTFFKLCSLILNNCPNSVVIFAGADSENAVISSGIEQFGLQGRFIPIGYRKDIYEVFKHCDAYINTYPIGGGLMCQYAAQCSKPILNYRDNGIEECIAQKTECSFTSLTGQDLIQEAVRLYSDNEYKLERGNAMRRGVISKDEFDKALLTYLQTNKPFYNIEWEDHFEQTRFNVDDAIVYTNKKLAAFYYKLFQLLGIDSLFVMPGNVFSLGVYGVKRQLRKIFKR